MPAVAGGDEHRIIASMSEVERVLTARARLGESPVWDPAHRQLAWVDIYNHRVHEFDPATGRDRYVETEDLVAAIAPTGDDRLLVAQSHGLGLLDFESGELEPLCTLKFPHEDTRFNDGKCDAYGRFWVGTISQHPGEAALYRYDPDGSLHTLETGLTISNGLGWSPDGQTFYLTDSPKRAIYAYHVDSTGAISDRRVLVDLTGEEVEPDGLAIDRKGNLWSALWDGWAIACFDAEGRELERVRLPVQRPTSVAFGGNDLAELYVTSASIGLSQAEIQRGFYAGDLFRVSAPAPGLPPHAFGRC
jgi:sugar lactone lactonase YvrE